MSIQSLTASPEAARRILVVVWFAAFLLNFSMLLYLYADNWIAQENFKTALYQLNALYAPYLGAILAFYFTSSKRHETGAVSGTAFWLAAIASVLWNAVIVVLLARVFFLLGQIEPTVRDLLFFGSTLSWLVAPAMGFYFASASSTTSGHPHES